jgi:transposase
MTVKEIAQAIGKDASTVSRWVEKVSCKMQEVYRKVQEAKATSKPADYNLKETCQIIESGMGSDVASVFYANATGMKSHEMIKPEESKQIDHKAMAELRRAFDRGLISVDEFRIAIGLKYPKSEILDPSIAKQVYAVACNAYEKKNKLKQLEDKSGTLDL